MNNRKKEKETILVGRNIAMEVLTCLFGHSPRTREEFSKSRAACRVLAWLGLGATNELNDIGFEAGYLLELYGCDWANGPIMLKVGNRANCDVDVIESIIDSGLGSHADDKNLRLFAIKTLVALRLICLRFGHPNVPTKILKSLAVWRRKEERQLRSIRRTNEQLACLRGARKEAGLYINPERAQVCTEWRQMFDPYGFAKNIPVEMQCIGSERFARAPDKDQWVLFKDLPPPTLAILTAKDQREAIKKEQTRT
jgi:hypothetical protein